MPLAGLQPVMYEFIMDDGFLLVSGHLSRIENLVPVHRLVPTVGGTVFSVAQCYDQSGKIVT